MLGDIGLADEKEELEVIRFQQRMVDMYLRSRKITTSCELKLQLFPRSIQHMHCLTISFSLATSLG